MGVILVRIWILARIFVNVKRCDISLLFIRSQNMRGVVQSYQIGIFEKLDRLQTARFSRFNYIGKLGLNL